MSRTVLRLITSLILVIIFAFVGFLIIGSIIEPSKNMPRFVHHHYARTNGYFWIKCPVTGRMFGGHESYSGRGIIKPESLKQFQPNEEESKRALIILQVAEYDIVSEEASVILEELRSEGVEEKDMLDAARKRWSKRHKN